MRGRRDRRARGAALKSVGHDLWFGAELNPDFWGVDIKMFAYVPSLIGLLVLNLSFAVVQWEELGHLTTRMMLYQAFFTIYVFNYFQFEYGMLHTWDVIAENFGFMLVWGDAPFVPFFYSIGGWFVLRNPAPMPTYEAAALCLLVRRRAVDLPRHQPAEARLQRGSDGADLGQARPRPSVASCSSPASGASGASSTTPASSWSTSRGPCARASTSIVPYVLPLWLVCLFSHRAWRDEQRCRAKYGALWDEYCRRARFRMIPFVY